MFIPILQCCAPLVLSLLPFLLYKNRRIVCFSLFCSYKNVFYKVNTSLACLMDISRWQAGACSCMHWIMFVTCILMFFCSYVFLLLHPAFVKFRSLVLARDDVLALVVFCGCLLFFDRRTKEQKYALKNLISIQMDLMFIPILQCLHLRCWVFNSFCWIWTEGYFFCFFKNVVLGTYKFVCMMNVWQKWHELVHVRAVECSSLCILMFFCSYVWIGIFSKCP